MCRRALILLLALCAGLATSSPAGAESRAKDPAGYAEAVAQGVSELEAGNYPEAREEFMRAHNIYPNARTLRGLGMVEFELRNYAACVGRLKAALASSERPLEGKLRADTEALQARAQRYLGELRLEVSPRDAIVTVDGEAARVDTEGSFLLEVGSHELEVSAPGHVVDKRSIRVQGGERTSLRITLSAATAAGPTIAATQRESGAPRTTGAPSSEVQPTYKKWWLWTTIAIVVAGGATAAAVLLTRKSESPRAVETNNAAGPTLQTLRSF